MIQLCTFICMHRPLSADCGYVLSEVLDTAGTDRLWCEGRADWLEQRRSDVVNSLILSWEWRAKSPETHRKGRN